MQGTKNQTSWTDMVYYGTGMYGVARFPSTSRVSHDGRFHCIRFRFRSSLSRESSSPSCSAVSVGLRICAMDPLLVGGVELSFTLKVLLSRFDGPQENSLKLTPLPPLAKGGGGVAGRDRET